MRRIRNGILYKSMIENLNSVVRLMPQSTGGQLRGCSDAWVIDKFQGCFYIFNFIYERKKIIASIS